MFVAGLIGQTSRIPPWSRWCCVASSLVISFDAPRRGGPLGPSEGELERGLRLVELDLIEQHADRQPEDDRDQCSRFRVGRRSVAQLLREERVQPPFRLEELLAAQPGSVTAAAANAWYTLISSRLRRRG